MKQRERLLIANKYEVAQLEKAGKLHFRRAISAQPSRQNMKLITLLDTTGDKKNVGKHQWATSKGELIGECDEVYFSNPFGKPEGALLVKETWATSPRDEWAEKQKPSELPRDTVVYYRADENGGNFTWRSSMHMPRWACRFVLNITSIKAVRLQDISEEEAEMSGVEPLFSQEQINQPHYKPELDLRPMTYKNYLWHGAAGVSEGAADSWSNQYSDYKTAVGSYSSLWQRLNGKKYTWDSNIWVWACDAEIAEKV